MELQLFVLQIHRNLEWTIMTDANREKIELVRHIYALNQEILQMADTKSSIVLGLSGIVVSLIIGMNIDDFSFNKQLSLGIAIIFSSLTSVTQFCTIFPRLAVRDKKGILFYRDILKWDRDGYTNEIININSTKILNDYADSVYSLAKIQEKKYFWLKIGFIFLIISITLISISFYL